MQTNKKKIISRSIGILLILIGYFFLNRLASIYIPCLFHEITGLHCPGCGVTRMFHSLLKLEIYQAFRYNPFLFCLLNLYLIYKLLSYIYYKKTNKKISLPSWIYYILIILLLIFGLLRNLPFFDWLAPTFIK